MSDNKLCGENGKTPCISLIGMAGAGKSTIGNRLAKKLGWAFMDSDYLIQSLYAAPLQDIVDAMDRDSFLDVEEAAICAIRAHRCVIATGGSVVYRPGAMRHLAKLGAIVHVRADLEKILERIAINPKRGLVLAPGQTVADLLQEREILYNKYSGFDCDSSSQSPDECANRIIAQIRNNPAYGI